MLLKKILCRMRGIDLAPAVGVHPVTISSWKGGRSVPPATRIPLLAQVLGVSLADMEAAVEKAHSARRQRMEKAP